MRKIALVLSTALLLGGVPVFSACGESAERTHYTIRGEFLPDESVFAATMSVDVLNKTDAALDMLSFELYPNAYREGAKYDPIPDLYEPVCYYAGKSYGGIEIESVEGGAFEVAGEDENILHVSLPEALYPDEHAALTVRFRVLLPHVNHRLGVGEHAVNLANFYPVLCAYNGGFSENVYSEYGDPFVSECADYDVEISVPAPLEVLGATLSSEGEKRVYTYSIRNARDVAFVLGEGFQTASGEACGVPVVYRYFADDDPNVVLTAAKESLEGFSELFTPYEYPSYTVVQTDFPYGGMEYPALAMISSLLREEEKPHVVAHETAHQWWYAMVGSDQFREAWQDEGLAEWSVALLSEKSPAFGNYRAAVNASEKAYRAFFSVLSQVNGAADTRMSRPLTEYSGLYEYRSVAYDKGVILFDRLRDVAGEKLIKGLKNYAEEYSGKIATPADLSACLARAGANTEELLFSFTEGRCVI